MIIFAEILSWSFVRIVVDALMFPTKAGFRIRFELFPRSGEGERFDKLIVAQKPVGFAGMPASRDILDCRAGEDQAATILRNAFQST